jgi:hypothetical protein
MPRSTRNLIVLGWIIVNIDPIAAFENFTLKRNISKTLDIAEIEPLHNFVDR